MYLLIQALDLRENPINPISLPQNLIKTPRKPDKPDKPDGLEAPKGKDRTRIWGSALKCISSYMTWILCP